MKKITKKLNLENGLVIRQPIDRGRLLNLKIVRLLKKTKQAGILGIPVLHCDTDVYPDFLALYRERSLYHKTLLTGVCFYAYDREFDGENGLFNAIYYDNKERLKYFKERFRNVKFIITPDYSVFGDMPRIENLHRIFKARIVALWFIFELHKVVIPNISYTDEDDFSICFSGLETCSVIAFNAKGHVKYPGERKLLEAAVKYAVDNLQLKAILVYSVCRHDENCLRIFQYAMERGIQVRIINNSLRERNVLRRAS